MNQDLLTQMIRDIYEKNTINDNPFSYVLNSNINFIDTAQFKNKMIVSIEIQGSKVFYVLVLSPEELESLPR